MPAYCHPAAFSAFERELPTLDSSSHSLFRAAFAIARHELPSASVSDAEQQLDSIANAVASRVHSPNPEARLAHLHDLLFEVIGFTGNIDDYYNPANSYLPHVMATRRGLPITLVLIYKMVGEATGLTVRGINSPGHFLAAVKAADAPTTPRDHSAATTAIETGTTPRTATASARWMYVDPFYGGELLNSADVCRRIAETTGLVADNPAKWLAPATNRQWLSRMLNNLQAVFARSGRERDVYAMQELQTLL